jgi:TonB family protein
LELPVWINNLIAYSLQIAILASMGTLLAYLFRLQLPRVTLLYWQGLLLVCLFVPCLQHWERSDSIATIPGSVLSSSEMLRIGVPINAGFPGFLGWKLAALILGVGIFLRIVWLAAGFLRLHLFHHKSCLFLDEHAAVREMQWRTGVRVSLRLSGEIHSPVTYGLRSPTIILPLSFQDLSESCQKAVLCHELLHVRRNDWILIIVEELVCSLFWFHPAIWWLRSRIHLAREQAVDQEVVQLTGNKQPYLDSLLEFARAQRRLTAVPAPLFLKEHHLVQRVALLLKEVSMSRSRLTVSMIGISVLLICTVRIASGWFPLTIVPAPAAQQQDETKVKAPQRDPIHVGANVQESKVIHMVDPVYPEQARMLRIRGTIKLAVLINEEGFVYETKPEPGNNPLLEKAAIDAVKQWRFSQTFLNGQPVPVLATVMVEFNLKDSPGIAEERKGPSEVSPTPPAPIRIGNEVVESKLIRRVEPVYPEEAKTSGIQGSVVLEISVDEKGYVQNAEVISGDLILSEAAIKAVKQWQYSPTLLNGEPVPAFATVTVVFNLQ